jgi:hypothetical protein
MSRDEEGTKKVVLVWIASSLATAALLVVAGFVFTKC